METTPPALTNRLSGTTILVVEDSWHIAFAIETVLRAEGAEILGPAASLQDAERLIAQNPCDIALVDINLNGVMAFDLIEALLREKRQVVVMSGYDIDEALRSRVSGVIEKPFDPAALVKVLEALRAG
jgi:DNA-binding response OmpR family regulator